MLGSMAVQLFRSTWKSDSGNGVMQTEAPWEGGCYHKAIRLLAKKWICGFWIILSWLVLKTESDKMFYTDQLIHFPSVFLCVKNHEKLSTS